MSSSSFPLDDSRRGARRSASGLQPSSSILSLASSTSTSGSSDVSDTFAAPTAETAMGSSTSRIAAASSSKTNGASRKARGKRAVRDDADGQDPQAESSNGKEHDLDVMASPTKRQRRDKSSVTLGVESVMNASRAREKPISHDGISSAADELAHLTTESPTKANVDTSASSSSSRSPTRMVPVVEIPYRSGSRSRTASRDNTMQIDPSAQVDPSAHTAKPVQEREPSTERVADVSSELSAAEEPMQSPKRATSRKGKGRAIKAVTAAKPPSERKSKGKARKSTGDSGAIQQLMNDAGMTLEDARAILQAGLPAAPKRRNAIRVETYVEPDSDEDAELEAQLLREEEAERKQRSRKSSRKGAASTQYVRSQARGSSSVKGSASKKRSKDCELFSEADELDEGEMSREEPYGGEDVEEYASDYVEEEVKKKPHRGRKPKTSALPKSASDSANPSGIPLELRKGKTKTVTSKKAASTPKERSASVSSSSSLPALPSFPLSSQPGPVVWDFGLLDTTLFVTVCARSKAIGTELSGSEKAVETSPPLFWWPARISSRNRLNFRVKLIVDKQRQVLQFSDVEITIPPNSVDEHHIVNFSNSITGELGIKNSEEAFTVYRSHPSAGSYEVPSESAYESAVAIALKEKQREDSDDDLPDAIMKPQGKKSIASGKASRKAKSYKPKGRKPKAAEKEDESSGDEELKGHLSILNNRGLSSSDEDSDAENGEEIIPVGEICLAEQNGRYWPAKVVAYHPGGFKPTKGKKKGPYQVQLYPPAVGYLSRDQIVAEHDDEFRSVTLGEIKEEKTALGTEDLEAILPDIASTLQEQYMPAEARHKLFFGTRYERGTALMQMIRLGAFSEEDTDFVTAYLLEWLHGRKVKAATQPPSKGILERLPEQDRTNYVTGVLMPLALELLYIFDNPEVETEAKAALEKAGAEVDDKSVRMQEHLIAIDHLTKAKKDEWWKSIYAKRQILDSGVQMQQEQELDMEDMFGLTGRRQATRNIKYKE